MFRRFYGAANMLYRKREKPLQKRVSQNFRVLHFFLIFVE